MRLRFTLKRINIDPVCHIQILRHADQLQNHYVYGQLYGALLQDQAEVNNALPYNETAEDLQTYERRFEQQLTKFNLDSENLGWYFVSFKRNFWDQLELCKFYEKYINTSFFLVFDYKARLQGQNPYRAYRLSDEFATKTDFKWSDLTNFDMQKNNPFIQIQVGVHKNQIFSALMLFNRQKFISQLSTNRNKPEKQGKNSLKNHIQDYIETFQQQIDLQMDLNELSSKQTQAQKKRQDQQLLSKEYSTFVGQTLKLQNYEQFFKRYQKGVKEYSKVFGK